LKQNPMPFALPTLHFKICTLHYALGRPHE
jgi:hypothetical protein